MAKYLPCIAEDTSSIPGPRAEIPHASRPQNSKYKTGAVFVANSIKAVKMALIKKKTKTKTGT